MFKKSLLSMTLAALMLCVSLVGCASPDASSSASSASASSASAASSSASSSSSASAAEEGTIEVTVEFDTDLLEGTAAAEGTMPFTGPKAFDLEEGATAYDALVATGAELDGTPSYVTSINGIGEGEAGSASGWMYMVDDEVPSVAANEYVLKAGDSVIWYYGSWN